MDKNSSPKIKRTCLKRRRGRDSTQWQFDPYIRRINREMNPNMSIQKDSMEVINNLLEHFGQRVCEEAKILCKLAGRKTLFARDLIAAVKLIVTDKAVYKHSSLESKKALIAFAISYATHE